MSQLPSVDPLIDRLESAGIGSKHFDQARAFEARAAHLADGFTARTDELRAALVEDLATGAAELDDALDRVGELVIRHAVATPAAVSIVNRDVIEATRHRCTMLAWSALRAAGPEIDAQTRDRLAGINEQLGKLEAQLPAEARGGGSLPSSASRDVVGIWGDAVDARRRCEALLRLRAELRAAGLVEATDEEAQAEAAAEEWRLRRLRGEVATVMMREPADLQAAPAPGFDRLVAAALGKGA